MARIRIERDNEAVIELERKEQGAPWLGNLYGTGDKRKQGTPLGPFNNAEMAAMAALAIEPGNPPASVATLIAEMQTAGG